MFVQRLREQFPSVGVTEAHPKVLLKILGKGNWGTFCRRFDIDAATPTEDERDAIIAAVAAREGFQRNWRNDLSKKRTPAEQNPKTYHLAPVHYYWPSK